MSEFIISTQSDSYKKVPVGIHLARCYRIIDLGSQKSSYKGKENINPKILIQFEVHGEDNEGLPLITDDGKPLSISKKYTRSLGEKANLRKDLQTWRGRNFTPQELMAFNLANVLGSWAMIVVVEVMDPTGKTYNVIDSITPVPPKTKSQGLPEGVNETSMFQISSGDVEELKKLSQTVQKTIMQSPEYAKYFGGAPVESNGFEDLKSDIPF